MSVLGLLLAAVGVADAVPRLKVLVGVLVLGAGGFAIGAGWGTVSLVIVGALVVWVWVDADRRQDVWGVVVMALAVLGLVIAAPALLITRSPLQDWYGALPFPGLAGLPLPRAFLGLGVLLFLTTAANVVVRRALASVGPQVAAQEHSLRGGRLLGPMERWLVFAFAVSGNLGALAGLVAAKGILRFPEISRDSPGGLRAEYVLVGSFVSWTLALAFVPLF